MQAIVRITVALIHVIIRTTLLVHGPQAKTVDLSICF